MNIGLKKKKKMLILSRETKVNYTWDEKGYANHPRIFQGVYSDLNLWVDLNVLIMHHCYFYHLIISKCYIAYLSTKQGTQGAEYKQTFRKIGYCGDEF